MYRYIYGTEKFHFVIKVSTLLLEYSQERNQDFAKRGAWKSKIFLMSFW